MTATKPFALIPAYSHIDDRLLDALGQSGIPFHSVRRCSDLPKARSQLLSFALEQTEAEVFLLIDSDIVPTPAQLEQLAGSEKLRPYQAVTGAYALPTGRAAFVPEELDTPVELGEPGYRLLSGAGLGFCAIHRQSLAQIASVLPRITNGATCWRPFCVPIFVAKSADSADYYPDDYVLWYRHRALGGMLWLDQELLVAHVLAEPRRPLTGAVTRD